MWRFVVTTAGVSHTTCFELTVSERYGAVGNTFMFPTNERKPGLVYTLVRCTLALM